MGASKGARTVDHCTITGAAVHSRSLVEHVFQQEESIMRIAQLAPLTESVPPSHYGGTERVVAELTDELVRRGHEVTLFASGDSQTSADLVPVVPQALRLAGVPNAVPYHLTALSQALAQAADFDVIHSHLDVLALPFSSFVPTPMVHTMHGRLDLPEIQPLLAQCRDAGLVSISDNQRRLLEHCRWLGTVYNGIDLDRYTFHPRPGQYLDFLGRITPEKGIEEAIAVARLAGLPLKVAAKVDPVDQEYYESQIRPLFEDPLIDYVGEVTDAEKDAFLGQARALLFPIKWPEPFGLVMAEAMATGTPVITSRFGSVPEVIADGVTGILCDSVEEMALACARIESLDRSACRRRVEACFSMPAMVDGYEAIYQRLVAPSPGEAAALGEVVSEPSRQPNPNGHLLTTTR
jgi:glycosyltransferase involved in cell wall biosynthesis